MAGEPAQPRGYLRKKSAVAPHGRNKVTERAGAPARAVWQAGMSRRGDRRAAHSSARQATAAEPRYATGMSERVGQRLWRGTVQAGGGASSNKMRSATSRVPARRQPSTNAAATSLQLINRRVPEIPPEQPGNA